jgi:hypothetical protein
MGPPAWPLAMPTDADERLLLFGGRTLIGNHPDGPVPLHHLARRPQHDHEAEAIE